MKKVHHVDAKKVVRRINGTVETNIGNEKYSYIKRNGRRTFIYE